MTSALKQQALVKAILADDRESRAEHPPGECFIAHTCTVQPRVTTARDSAATVAGSGTTKARPSFALPRRGGRRRGGTAPVLPPAPCRGRCSVAVTASSSPARAAAGRSIASGCGIAPRIAASARVSVPKIKRPLPRSTWMPPRQAPLPAPGMPEHHSALAQRPEGCLECPLLRPP
jgi:hypothetical protein